MPMWMHPHVPPPPPPPKARAPTAFELDTRLMDAILKGDRDEARKVFDDTFWHKVEFRPAGYHLLQAALKGDRQMVTLLTSFGATWTPDEAKMAQGFVKPEQWKAIESPLKNAGIKTNYTQAEIKAADIMVAVRWSHRSVQETRRRGDKNWEEYSKLLDNVISAALINYVLGGDMDGARHVLLYRNLKFGTGTPGDPLDLTAEFDKIMDLHILAQGRSALKFLDTMKEAGFAIRPIEVQSTHIIIARDIVQELDKRGLLKKDSKSARRDVLGDWTWLQEQSELAGMAITVEPEEFRKQNEGYKNAVTALFDRQHPVTDQEAEEFIRLHETRATTTPYGLANAERQLLELGFFDGPAWTADRLKRLANAGDLPDAQLKDVFNGKAARAEMLQTTLPKVLNPKKFQLVEQAHKSGAWKASAEETLAVVEYMAGEVKKDAVPEQIARTLKIMSDAGADFSRIDPSRYLGKTGPGLAKALLDAGAVPAESFDLDGLVRKNGGSMNLVIPQGKPGFEYNEFICQLILEIAEPIKYIPLRNTPGQSYQKHFIKEWVESLSRRTGGTITYRKRTPTPPKPAGPKI